MYAGAQTTSPTYTPAHSIHAHPYNLSTRISTPNQLIDVPATKALATCLSRGCTSSGGTSSWQAWESLGWVM